MTRLHCPDMAGAVVRACQARCNREPVRLLVWVSVSHCLWATTAYLYPDLTYLTTAAVAMANLLQQIRHSIAVDVDSMDPAVASRHAQDGQLFCDMTSNQAIVYSEAVKSERRDVLAAACEAAKTSGLDVEHQVADSLDLLVWIRLLTLPITAHQKRCLINVERAIG